MNEKMLPVKFERKIDAAGRIVIPEEIRKKMNIAGGDKLMIEYTDKGILISIKK